MTAQFGVFASSDAGDTLNAFNLPIDFGINGHDGPLLPLGVLDLPAGFAFNSVVADPGLGGAVNITGDAALPPIFTQNYDGVFNSSGLSLALGTGQTRLFDVLIDVTAAPGAVLPIAITDDVGPPTNPTVSGPFSVTLNGDPALNAGDVGYSLNAGSITVTAVPEPASWTVIGVALCGGALSRRRRKRAAGGRTK
ncbi:signal peptide protein [Rhodopirellula europaea SH398]|uniref:Signal peptide protein n=2 Tax=Rhodopirellula TaxID=265488 RepID=M5SLA8_9BACT|nr:signal peptide protein [Rhodopirellula europaea SH398]